MESLAPLCLEALKLFRQINNVNNPRQLGVDQKSDEWPKAKFAAEADRFELWALTPDPLALEYLNGEAQLFMEEDDASDTESEPESDMGLLLSGVRDPIDRLFKLSIWIRNPATRLASSKAQHFRQIDEETNVNLLDVFEAFDLDHVRSLFLQYRKHAALQEKPTLPPVEEKEGKYDEDEEDEGNDYVWEPIRTVLLQHENNIADGTESYLVRRIARANGRRRQQFAYWRKHRDKLHQHATAAIQQVSTSGLAQDPIQASTEPIIDGSALPADAPGNLSVTTASRLNLPQAPMRENMSNVSVSEYAPSAWQPSKDVVDFPPPPSIDPTEQFFECPYCFTLCSKALLAEKAWKAHLIHDLRPYICTYEHCRNPDQLYDTQRDWIQHENASHRRIFRCPEHEDRIFTTLASYQEHTHEQHGGGSLSDESILTQVSESTLAEADRCCPVCSLAVETAEKMQSHIALHLERFALFSMPRWVDDGKDVRSAVANFDSDGSRAEDLGVELSFVDDADQGRFEQASPPASRADFEIAIICALPLEYDAVTYIFDEFWDENGDQYGRATGDPNSYTTGRVGKCNVVLALLPHMGKATAASAAASMRSSYGGLRLALLVGVCGGMPRGRDGEILLGDVVISKTVIQYDFGRKYPDKFVRKNTVEDNLGRPNKDARNLVATFETDRGLDRLEQRTADFLRQLQASVAQTRRRGKYDYPGRAEDKLFEPTYRHKHHLSPTCICRDCFSDFDPVCDEALSSSCASLGCDDKHLIARKRLQAQPQSEHEGGDTSPQPAVHVGVVASGDRVMKSAADRDRLSREAGVIAFEMESAEVWDDVPCIVVKGVCDYADSHKHKGWQNFAAATAASASKAILERYIQTNEARFRSSHNASAAP
ncbi:hypothetical protein MRS44_013280 [Fusarium solani]|uniref:uncharacterized protein n=1 Tax=Fusarium solani TaxID=169388 RepID=UPI0032C47195|nr:hypothetical protein MRS44_013280 [Fusarium solani]